MCGVWCVCVQPVRGIWQAGSGQAGGRCGVVVVVAKVACARQAVRGSGARSVKAGACVCARQAVRCGVRVAGACVVAVCGCGGVAAGGVWWWWQARCVLCMRVVRR